MVLLSRKEAAARLDISVATLDAERRDGNLEYIQRRPNGKVWISEEAVAAYLARATHPVKHVKVVRDTYRKKRT